MHQISDKIEPLRRLMQSTYVQMSTEANNNNRPVIVFSGRGLPMGGTRMQCRAHGRNYKVARRVTILRAIRYE